jgi:glycosyltransferase involved in cell wall biosynthesis
MPISTGEKRLQVLLSAYQCGPGMGSASQIGWEWYSRLSRRTRVTLITHIRNRHALNQAGAPLKDSEVIFIDTEWFAGPLYRFAKRLFPRSEHSVFMLSGLDFYVYDFVALRILKRRLAAGARWDLAHAVTPVTTLAATTLHRLGIPVIKGPLNNGVATPSGFASILCDDYTWLAPLRNIGKLMDLWAGSTRNAAAILIANSATQRMLPERYRPKCIPMLENAVDIELFRPAPWPSPPSVSTPLRVLFVGRLVPFKALPLLLRGLARIRNEFPVELEVIGDGPMRDVWRREAVRLSIQGMVKFVGARSLDEVAAAMRAAHVLCLPSLRESGGSVLLEAMASARPIIAVAFGGPAGIVDEVVGQPIAPDSVEGVVSALAASLRDIVRQPETWKQRGAEGRFRAEHLYSWDAKLERATALYTVVVQSKRQSPAVFGTALDSNGASAAASNPVRPTKRVRNSSSNVGNLLRIRPW